MRATKAEKHTSRHITLCNKRGPHLAIVSEQKKHRMIEKEGKKDR